MDWCTQNNHLMETAQMSIQYLFNNVHNMDCLHSLESTHGGSSNKYPVFAKNLFYNCQQHGLNILNRNFS